MMERLPKRRRLTSNIMRLLSLALCLGLLAPLSGQNPAPEQPPAQPQEEPYRFGAGINLVTAPVTVVGPDKRFVDGLLQEHFKVYDNDREQQITGFDVSFLPISLVLCVQTSTRVEGLLPQIKKSGILYTQLVLGENGEAAIITFDTKVDVAQGFTKDWDKFEGALKKLRVGNDSTRLADAVWQAIRLLRNRPDNHRKVIVLVSESQDNGSETSLGEALRDAQLANILVYGIRLSTTKARLTQSAPQRRDPIPPGVSGRPTPPGVVSTPTTQAQARVEVVNALPYIIEAVRGVKNLFFSDPLQLMTQGTGGQMLAPLTEGGMEESVSRIGEELRSQYLLSYRPNNLTEGGFHRIRVEVAFNGLEVRTRPGYWLGPVPVEN
jgi:VWFA-related protein